MLPNLTTLRRLGPFGLLLAASAALPLVGSALLLAYTPQVEPHLRAAGPTGLATFALAIAVLCGLALMNTQVDAHSSGALPGNKAPASSSRRNGIA